MTIQAKAEKWDNQALRSKKYYEENKKRIQARQREYEAEKRKTIKKKLERLEMLETYLEQQGIAI